MSLLRQDVLWFISHLLSKDALGRHLYEKLCVLSNGYGGITGSCRKVDRVGLRDCETSVPSFLQFIPFFLDHRLRNI